jgi:hypothetical protein
MHQAWWLERWPPCLLMPPEGNTRSIFLAAAKTTRHIILFDSGIT